MEGEKIKSGWRKGDIYYKGKLWDMNPGWDENDHTILSIIGLGTIKSFFKKQNIRCLRLFHSQLDLASGHTMLTQIPSTY